MIAILLSLALTAPPGVVQQTPAALDAASVARFADLAVACVRQEYPNKIDYEPSGEDFLPVLEIADKRRRR